MYSHVDNSELNVCLLQTLITNHHKKCDFFKNSQNYLCNITRMVFNALHPKFYLPGLSLLI